VHASSRASEPVSSPNLAVLELNTRDANPVAAGFPRRCRAAGFRSGMNLFGLCGLGYPVLFPEKWNSIDWPIGERARAMDCRQRQRRRLVDADLAGYSQRTSPRLKSARLHQSARN
jgi:hypothetical protein